MENKEIEDIVNEFKLGTQARKEASEEMCREAMALAVSSQSRKCVDCPYGNERSCPAQKAGDLAFKRAQATYQRE